MTIRAAAKVIVLLLTSKNLSIACSESCTGGWASKAITDIPGASTCFLGSIVAYSNYSKEKFLAVPYNTINQFGAVSEETALAMAKGTIKAFNSYCAFSITGIAGPKGGSKEKPVGTVCFGFCIQDQCFTDRQVFKGNRNMIRKYAVLYAFNRIYNLCKATSQV